MSGTFKPVASDATVQMLVEAMRSNNTNQREIRDLISIQNEILMAVKTAIDVGNTMPIMICPVTYDGAAYVLDGVTVDAIANAINSGVLPVMRIIHESNAFFIAYSRTTYHPKTGAVLSYQCDTDKNCPDGTFGIFSIDAASGAITKNPVYALQEMCRNLVVYVGNAEDVDAAIAENLPKMLERERATWKLAQSVAEV